MWSNPHYTTAQAAAACAGKPISLQLPVIRARSMPEQLLQQQLPITINHPKQRCNVSHLCRVDHRLSLIPSSPRPL
jgi:hypothetical protein